MKYKIVVDKQSRTNPSADKKEYIIDIEELRFKGNVYDSLVITKDEDYVMRRLELTDFYVLKELETPKKEPLENINIELFEGDNYIYLVDMVGNKFYAEYLVKNEFNDIYVTLNQMHSAINQSANEVEIAVNQKLTKYSTTEEMNSAINVKANEITSSVSKNYTTKEELTTTKTEIKQTTDNISSTVSKKVGKDEVISTVNQSAEAVTINANKININGVISANGNFKVDTNGNMECNNGKFNGGKISLQGGTEENPNFEIKGTESNALITPNKIRIGNGSKYISAGIDTVPMISMLGDNTSLQFYDNLNKLNIKVSDLYVVNGIVHAQNFNYDSIEKLKKNIMPFSKNAVELIKNIDIYEYNFKSEKDETKKHIGFVIGDKYKYSKEITSNDNTGVDLYSFVSVCCKAIQEQQEHIQKLQNKIEELEARR